jgi:membrane protease YdiL (CAAX protease family)
MHESPTLHMLVTTDAAVAFLLLYFIPLLGQALLLFLGFAPNAVVGMECSIVMLMFGIMLLIQFAVIRNEGLAWRLRGNVGRTVLTYLGFSLLWVPFALMLYPVLVHSLESQLPAQPPLLYLVGNAPLEGRFLVLVVVCVLGPIGEELFFRGYIYRFVDVRGGSTLALWITSLWFGIMHGVEYALPLALMGFLFGYLRRRTGGLAAPILAHMLHNTLTVSCTLLWPELLPKVFDVSNQ